METPGGGGAVEGCVLLKQPVGLCAQTGGGGGAKQEDEVIAKVRGEEEGEGGWAGGCGWSLDE